MAWSFRNDSNNASGRNFNTNNVRSYGGNGQFAQTKPVKKHSGCTAGRGKNDKEYVQGWKYDKANGLRKFFAAPYHGTKRKTSPKSGRVWENWICRIELPSGEVLIRTCMYEPATKKVMIDALSFVMNPKGGKGGYVGPNFVRK